MWEYIAACTTCARSKSSNFPPSGFLHALPTPSRPYFHIAMDFFTGLPASQGNTVIFTVINRFSKSTHPFLSCPETWKLPTFWCITFSAIMAYLRISFLTASHYLYPRYGKRFALPWDPQTASCLVIIPSKTVKLRGQIQSWRWNSVAWQVKMPGLV